MAVFLRHLGEIYRGEIYVDDPSKEIFWNRRDCGNYQQLTLLNTDWTVAGNVKSVTLHTPGLNVPVQVKESEVKIIYVVEDKIFETDGNIHLEFGSGKITAHCGKETIVTCHSKEGSKQIKFTPQASTVCTSEL